jgi:hypothetical protein
MSSCQPLGDDCDAARERMALTLFEEWSRQDFDDLGRLLRLLANGFNTSDAAALSEPF